MTRNELHRAASLTKVLPNVAGLTDLIVANIGKANRAAKSRRQTRKPAKAKAPKAQKAPVYRDWFDSYVANNGFVSAGAVRRR